MLRLTICLLLAAGLVLNSISISAQQTNFTLQSPESLQQGFEAELAEYAATHTDDEVRQYAQNRLDQMTAQAMDVSASQLTSVVIDTLQPERSIPDPSGYLTNSFDTPDNYNLCISGRNEECRRQYNAALLQSAAVSTAIMAGCVAITVGSGLITCAALALAAHALGIAAASQQYQGCIVRAALDCRLEYPPTKKPPKPPGSN